MDILVIAYELPDKLAHPVQIRIEE